MSNPINRLVVVGVGLIGGSLAKAARLNGLANEVIGVAHRESTRVQALSDGVVDRAVAAIDDVISELGEGDLVMLALPPMTLPEHLANLAAKLSADVTLTDASSIKGYVVDEVSKAWGELPSNFVPGHPIAGSEQRGVQAVNPALYENHRVILTPTTATAENHLKRVEALWIGVGASVDQMDISHHDHVLAATSHLPHVLAYALVDTLFSLEQKREIFRYAAGGFRDFTRIAESDPAMWRDIVLTNREEVLEQLNCFDEHLQQLKSAIQTDDAEAVLQILQRAQEARQMFSEQMAKRDQQTD